jgi:hypothetical protein
MIRLRLFATYALAVVFFSAWQHHATAQEDPFGAPAGRPAEAAPPAEAPRRAAKGKAGETPEPPAPVPLVIELLRRSNPTTPQALMEAAQAAFRFGNPDEAKVYLTKLLAAKPADEALAALGARHTEFFLQLSTVADLQPEGKQVADSIFAAAQRVHQSSETIQTLIAQLSSDDAAMKHRSLERLGLAGSAAINPMLRTLADKSRAAEHPQIRSALVSLAATSERPLIAALDTTDNDLKMQLIAILARMGSRKATIRLVRPALDTAASPETRELARAALKRIIGAAPDIQEAERYLRLETDRFLAGELRMVSDPLDQVLVWQWHEEKQEVVPLTMPRRTAGDLFAARAAADLAALKPADLEARRLMLLTNLEIAKTNGGLDAPLSTAPGSIGAAALQSGAGLLSVVLAEALNAGRVPAAIAAAELLRQANDPVVLRAGNATSPVAEAMLSGDRRVRLAAALTAIKLAPGDSFPGAGRIAETLAWLARTRGDNVVLVGHPRGEDAQTLVAFAQALGYAGDAAYTGRDLTEKAFANPDLAMILISDAIDSPPVEELVQWLRRDFRTARVPVGVMARGDRLEQLTESLASDPFTTVFPRLHSLDVAGREIQRLKTVAGLGWIEREQRIAHAKTALTAIDGLAADPAAVLRYDLLRHEPTIVAALDHSALLPLATSILARFGTPGAQLALVEAASQTRRPLADRQMAAAALATAIKTRGLLLTQSQIGRQYDRYNASAALDKPTQELLGSILDMLESVAIARGELTVQE